MELMTILLDFVSENLSICQVMFSIGFTIFAFLKHLYAISVYCQNLEMFLGVWFYIGQIKVANSDGLLI